MLPTKDTQHVAESLALLLDQFKGKPVINGYLSTLARRVQDVENVLWDIIELRRLDVATGIQLDKLGALVGERRIGRSDADFRTGIRLRIRVNRSKGRIADIIDVAMLAAGPFPPRVTEYPFLGFEVELYGQTGERYLADLLSRTRAATSYGVLVASDLAASALLVWDDASSPVAGLQTFADVISGGRLCASAYGLPSDFSGVILAGAPTVFSVTPNTGAVGALPNVTISGANFTGATAVTIAGANVLSFAVVNSSTITAQLPSGSVGAKTVAVTTPAGTGSLAAAFTYTSAGSGPTVTALSHTVFDTAGGGQRLVITVNDSTGATGATLGGAALTSFAIDNGTQVSGVVPAGAPGPASVTVTNAVGTSAAFTGAKYWTPAQMTGAAGVYDANKGASASSWADQTGTAGAATQATGANQPVVTANAFGTLPGLTFNGSKVLALATRRVQASGRSVFFVGKWTSTIATPTAYAGNSPLVVVGDTSGSISGTAGVSAGSIDYTDANNLTRTTRGSGLNDGNPRLCGVTHDSTTSVVTEYVGATQQGATGVTSTYSAATWGWNAIGASYPGTGDGFVGTLGAVIVLDQVAVPAELPDLNAWSRQRFGTP